MKVCPFKNVCEKCGLPSMEVLLDEIGQKGTISLGIKEGMTFPLSNANGGFILKSENWEVRCESPASLCFNSSPEGQTLHKGQTRKRKGNILLSRNGFIYLSPKTLRWQETGKTVRPLISWWWFPISQWDSSEGHLPVAGWVPAVMQVTKRTSQGVRIQRWDWTLEKAHHKRESWGKQPDPTLRRG